MPQLKVQNFYSTSLTSDIVGTGDTSFTVTIAPTYTSGFLVISPNNASLREIVYFHNVVGNTVSVRAENRGQGGTTARAHTSSEPVAMKDIAEIFNMFSDSISQCFFVEKTGGLTVKVWGGTVFYNGNPVTVADTGLTLTDNQTNYIKYDYPTNTISVDTANSGNIKARVTTVSGAITSIQYYVAKESYIDFTVTITGTLPSQGGHGGKALITDGTNVSWGTPALPRNIGVGKGVDVDRVTGLEVYRTVSDVTAIETDDIFRMRDADGTYNDITGAALKADLAISVHPIGSIRDSTISGLFGAGYTLMQTQIFAGSDAFISKTGMGTARQGAMGGVIGTKMYVVGGDNGTSGAYTTNEEYDFALNTWSTKAGLPGGRSTAYHGVVGGKFYVIGGTNDVSVGTGNQVNTYEYDPSGNTWATKTNMSTAQSDGASGVYNGRIYIIGGINNAGTTLNTVQYYDVAGNSFTTGLAVIPNARRRTMKQGVSIGSKIYVCGGSDSGGTAQTSTYEYDAVGNSWATKTVMPGAIYGGQMDTLTVEGEVRIVSVSGFNGSSNVGNVYEFSPSGNSWVSRTTSAPQRRSSAAGVYLNELYYAGGWTTSPVGSLDKYTPFKNRYTYERTS